MNLNFLINFYHKFIVFEKKFIPLIIRKAGPGTPT